MKYYSLLFLFLISTYFSIAQEYNNQIELKLDNDEFLLSDKYYTSGIFFSYKRNIKKDLLFFKIEKGKIQYQFSFGNQMFTPQDIDYENINRFHRPYAGWLFGKLKTGHIKDKSAFFLGIETGITGKESLAKTFQDWAHSRVGIRKATWVEQISYKWLVNLEAQFLYSLISNQKESLMFSSKPIIGTKDLLIDNSLYYFFGKFSELKNSSRFSILNTSIKKEFFGFISFGHKYVFHNTLIEGSISNNDVLFTTDAEKNIFKWRIGLVSKNKKSVFKLSYNFNSKETPLSKFHGFGSISYGVNFH